MRQMLLFLALVWLLWSPVLIFVSVTRGRAEWRAVGWTFLGAYASLLLWVFLVWKGAMVLAAVAAPIAIALLTFAVRASLRTAADESTDRKG